MSWNPVNGGKEIASGVASRELIRFVDIGEEIDYPNVLYTTTERHQTWMARMTMLSWIT